LVWRQQRRRIGGMSRAGGEHRECDGR